MREVRWLVTIALVAGMAFALSACGGGTKTTTEIQTDTVTDTVTKHKTKTVTEQVPVPEAPPQPQPQPQPNGPADCTATQIYSPSTNQCINVPQNGSNPCPPGEFPMADRPVCKKG